MNNKPKVFILQKELPDIRAGAKFEKSPLGHYFCVGHPSVNGWLADVVENYEDWFLPEDEHELAKAKELLFDYGYTIIDPSGDHTFRFNCLKYTEEDMLRCFNYAMEYVMNAINKPERQPVTSNEFFNYINFLNKQTNGAR